MCDLFHFHDDVILINYFCDTCIVKYFRAYTLIDYYRGPYVGVFVLIYLTITPRLHTHGRKIIISSWGSPNDLFYVDSIIEKKIETKKMSKTKVIQILV